MTTDPYVIGRCPVCGKPWKADPRTGGVDHPPRLDVYTLRPEVKRPDDRRPQEVTILNICADYAPCAHARAEDQDRLDRIIAANTPGHAHPKRTLERYPNEVMPPAHLRPAPSLPLLTPSVNGKGNHG